jgi:hypothetical protein
MSNNPDSDQDDTIAGDSPDEDRAFDSDEESDPGEAEFQDEQERRLQEMEQRLESKEAELDERESRLEREEAELETHEDELLERREEVVTLHEEVESLESEIEERRQRLDEREAAIEEQERELDEREAKLDEQEQTLHTYVDDQLGDLQSQLSRTVRDAVQSSMATVEVGGVDEETLTQTIRQSVDSAIDEEDLEDESGAFGAVLGSLLAFLGILLVAGGVSNGLLTFVQTPTVSPLFAQSSVNYIASSILVIIGFAANLAAAAGRV